jgi:hypothetical protein
MTKRFTKVFLFIPAALFGGFSSAFSRKICDLGFDVYDFRGGASENFPVKDYKFTLKPQTAVVG